MIESIHSCHYPIPHRFRADSSDIVTYDVLLNGEQIYTGNISSYSAVEGIIEIDLSDIYRVYLQPSYETLTFETAMHGSLPVVDNKGTIQTFTVKSDYNIDDNSGEVSGEDKHYTVMYDYNKDYILTYPTAGIRNLPISTIVDPRQYISLVSYNVGAPDKLSYSFRNGQGGYTFENDQFHYIIFKPEHIGASSGDTITLSSGEESIEYTVKENCRSRYALYYMNLLGGLDTLLCGGKHVESFSVTRTDAEFHDDRSSRMDFQKRRIHQEISNKYKLTTGWLKNDVMHRIGNRIYRPDIMHRIENLIYSPKVWIHDLEKDTVTSCLVDDSNYTVKSFRNDRRLFYSIGVTESQRYMVK